MWRMKDMYIDQINEVNMREWYDYREYMILEIVNHVNYKRVFDILWESIYQWDPEESLVQIMNVLEKKTHDELLDIIKQLKW